MLKKKIEIHICNLWRRRLICLELDAGDNLEIEWRLIGLRLLGFERSDKRLKHIKWLFRA
jgi:hypothetical protein